MASSFESEVLGLTTEQPTEPPVADDDYQYLIHNQMVSQAIVPKFAAALSIFGSGLIIAEVIMDHRAGHVRDGATSRILISLGIADIFFSFAYLLGTIPAPSDLEYIWGNVGNTATCTFQGFILQLGWVSSPLFNIMLAFFFLLRIKYRWTDSRLKKLEPWVHGLIWIFALGSAIYPIPLGMYNNTWDICWIESYPEGCLDSYRYGDEATCTRGDNAWIHATIYQVFPSWVCIILAFVFMGMIVNFVRQIETKVSKYAGSMKQSTVGGAGASTNRSRAGSLIGSVLARARGGSLAMSNAAGDTVQTVNVTDRKKSQQVATQAIYYIGAFLLSYTLDLISGLLWYIGGMWFFWLDTFAYFLLPLLGFFNFCVFCRTRKMKSRVGRFTRRIVCCMEGKALCGGSKEEDEKESARRKSKVSKASKALGRATAYLTSKTMNDTMVQEHSIVERNPGTELTATNGTPSYTHDDAGGNDIIDTGSVDMNVSGRIAV